jgi:hypothetical protein
VREIGKPLSIGFELRQDERSAWGVQVSRGGLARPIET